MRLASIVLILWSMSASSVFSSEYLGILGEVTKPESPIASQLNLSEEQLAQLKQLVTRRTSAAVGLAATLKETPKSEHAELMADFASESERLAYDLLRPEQALILARLKIQWMGLISLAEDYVAEECNLADWQRDIIEQWREKVRVARRANEEEMVRPQAESAIRRELSDSQFQMWQFLAGFTDEPPEGQPQPPNVKEESAPKSTPQPTASTPAPSNAGRDVVETPIEQIELELNFQQLPWRDVIRWLADQAELSVHSELVPPGSFTYRDRSRTYSITEALDIMNAYLLDSGFALYRQGRFLRCINFEEDQDKRAELIKVLTDTVSVGELSSRGRYEPVRVLFNLERLNPDDIVDEVRDLLSIHGTAVSLVTSGQLLVTDMAGNVRNVAEFIRRSEDPASARGATVQSLPLTSINAEEVLAVARPLLELDADKNVSDSIKISTNAFGTMIYARGDMDKIQILRDLVKQMDRPPEGAERPISYETPYIGRHLVRGIDLELAYQVASQLLAGSPDVRLAKDDTAKQLVLQGRKADHQLLEDTLGTLAGEASDFKVIPLQSMDTVTAIAAVKKFFGLPDKPDPASGGPVIDGDATARQIWVKGSASQVRQIEELITKLEANAKTNRSMWGDRLRVIPTGGGTAEALKQAEMLWQQVYGNRNPIVNAAGVTGAGGLKTKTLAPEKPSKTADRRGAKDSGSGQDSTIKDRAAAQPTGGSAASPSAIPNASPATTPIEGTEKQTSTDVKSKTEAAETSEIQTRRTVRRSGDAKYSQLTAVPAGNLVAAWQDGFDNPEQQAEGDFSSNDSDIDLSSAALADSEGAPIVIREGPGGLMISSNDPDALERFENLLRMIMDQSNYAEIEPEVIYLQNIKAAVAKQLLTDILSGSASSGGGSGGLIGDMASGVLGGLGGGLLGSLLGGGGGSAASGSSSSSSSGMAVGQYSIVADPRLNVLFVKASPPDMKLIEQILRVIDQVEGPFSVEVQGVMELIPVVTQDVGEVLATVKSVFGDRIEGAAGGGAARQPAAGGGGQGNPGDFLMAMRSAFGGGRGNPGAQAAPRADISEPKMSIGADSFTNTLIVVGQPYQIEEVRRLVNMLDDAGESEQEEVVVVEMGALSSPALNDSLKRVLGPRALTNATSGSSGGSSGTTRTGPSSSSTGGQTGQSDADAARRRAEFFQRMIQGGGGGFGMGGNTGGRGTGGSTQSSGGGNRRR